MRCPNRPGIEPSLAIDVKAVLVMSMSELYLEEPPAVYAALHRQWRPAAEIALEMDGFGLRGSAIEINRLGHVFGRIRVGIRLLIN